MSSYKGQRGPNVSQYIATLNQPSPQQDLLADPAPAEDFSDFLNADFFDVSNASIDFGNSGSFDINFDNQPSQPLKSPEGFQPATSANMDFNLNGKCVSCCYCSHCHFLSQWAGPSSRKSRCSCHIVVCNTPSNGRLKRRKPTPTPPCCVACICYPHTMQINQLADAVAMQPCC